VQCGQSVFLTEHAWYRNTRALPVSTITSALIILSKISVISSFRTQSRVFCSRYNPFTKTNLFVRNDFFSQVCPIVTAPRINSSQSMSELAPLRGLAEITSSCLLISYTPFLIRFFRLIRIHLSVMIFAAGKTL
jgi:hypothetical protein